MLTPNGYYSKKPCKSAVKHRCKADFIGKIVKGYPRT